MRKITKQIIDIMGFLGIGLAFYAVPFGFCDLITVHEAIVVLLLGGTTTTIAQLTNNLIK